MGQCDSDSTGGPHHFGLLSLQKPLALTSTSRRGHWHLGLGAWPRVRAQEPVPLVPARQDVSEPSWPFLSPGIPWEALWSRPSSLLPSTSFRVPSNQLSSGGFSASLPGSPHFPSPSSTPGSKLGAGARGTVGSESGGRGNRPAKEHVNRKWQVLQQGSTQEGFPQEVTCKLGQGHASTMWPEQGCAGAGAVGGEARAGQAWSSRGSALCQDPARSNPSEDPTDSCQRAPMLTPPTSSNFRSADPFTSCITSFHWGILALLICSPLQEDPLLPLCLPPCLPLKASPHHCPPPAHSHANPWEPPL